MVRPRSVLRAALSCALVVVMAAGIPGVAVAHAPKAGAPPRAAENRGVRHVNLSDAVSSNPTLATRAPSVELRTAGARDGGGAAAADTPERLTTPATSYPNTILVTSIDHQAPDVAPGVGENLGVLLQDGGNTVAFIVGGSNNLRGASISVPTGLAVGSYVAPAVGYPQVAVPGCAPGPGHFDIWEITKSGDTLTSFAASAAVMCGTSPATVEFRYNSSRPWAVETVTPSPVYFNIPDGTTSDPAIVTLGAVGTAPVSITNPSVTPSAFAVVSNTCTAGALTDGQSCVVGVTYQASSTSSGTLSYTTSTYAGQGTVPIWSSHYFGPSAGDTSGPSFQSSDAFGGATTPACTISCDGSMSIAASPSEVMQVTRQGLAVFDRLGDVLGVATLVDFFAGDSGYPADHARVAWDALHSRWVATATGTDCSANEGYLWLAASDSADPMGGWSVWVWSFDPGDTPGYPSIGFSSDKVGIGFEADYISSCGPSGVPHWTDALIVDAANVYSGSGTVHTRWLGGPSLPTVPPLAQGLSVGNDLFAVGGAKFARITGTVAQQNVTISPLANLPGNASALGGRPDNAYWQNGKLWASGTQECTPRGTTRSRVCARLLGFTTASTPQKLQDFAIGGADSQVSGTQLAVAGDGSVALVWSEQLRVDNVPVTRVRATYRTATDPANTMRTPVVLATDNPASLPYWFGYSAVAPDPRDPRGFWATASYDDSGTQYSIVYQLQEAGPLRLGGADRFGTADLISSNTFAPGVDAVYIATAFNFPDALAGAAAAGKVKGPILLTSVAGPLDEGTKAELTRLKPKKIIVLGSNGVVSDTVFSSLGAYAPLVQRYSGADRYGTAAAISANTFAPGVDVAYVAYAFNFPDALAGAAAAGTINGPILLAATTGTLNSATAAELQRLQPKKIVVLGSPGVIANDVFDQLTAYSTNVVRYSGSDRYGTAVAISQNTFSPGVDRVYIAYSMNFPDALAGAAAAGTVKGPILLAPTTGTIDAATLAEVQRLQPKQIVVLGSAGVVSDQILTQLLPYTVH